MQFKDRSASGCAASKRQEMERPRARQFGSGIRVVIADNYPFFRRGLRSFIEEASDLQVVGEAGSVQDLLRLCQDLRPDIVLVDLDLDGADGVSMLDTLRERAPKARHILLATPEDEESLVGYIEDGVHGCVMKNADPPVILSAIRAVNAGQCWLQRELTGSIFEELRRARRQQRDSAHARITGRETEVLRLVAEGLSNSQIAQRLFISERTVKVHVANIFSKLRLHDRVQATRHAIRTGLVRA